MSTSARDFARSPADGWTGSGHRKTASGVTQGMPTPIPEGRTPGGTEGTTPSGSDAGGGDGLARAGKRIGDASELMERRETELEEERKQRREMRERVKQMGERMERMQGMMEAMMRKLGGDDEEPKGGDSGQFERPSRVRLASRVSSIGREP